MAGDTTPIVNNWILDYYTYSAWREFKAENTISASTLDSIAGINLISNYLALSFFRLMLVMQFRIAKFCLKLYFLINIISLIFLFASESLL
jgi:hypothetical protein